MNIYIYMVFKYIYIIVEFIKYKLYIQSLHSTLQKIIPVLANMSVLYVKVFQWFSHSLDKNNSEYDKIFIKYINKVDYTEADFDAESINKLVKTITDDGHSVHIDSKPINAGTVAIVYKGKIDEEEIVIKVLRKNVHAAILRDIEWIEFILKYINWFTLTNCLHMFIVYNLQHIVSN